MTNCNYEVNAPDAQISGAFVRCPRPVEQQRVEISFGSPVAIFDQNIPSRTRVPFYMYPYGDSDATPMVTCTAEDGNGTCLPNFTFKLWAQYGSVSGTVILAKSKEPSGAGIRVTATDPEGELPQVSTLTDANGHYTFTQTDPALLLLATNIERMTGNRRWRAGAATIPASNNWGLRVYGDGAGVAPWDPSPLKDPRLFYSLTEGKKTWRIAAATIDAGSFARGGVDVEVTGGHESIVNMTLGTVPWKNVPPECMCGSGPLPPSCVGLPISVTSGNVITSSVDATVVGLHALRFVRTYSSLVAFDGDGGALGRGWSHSFEASLVQMSETEIMLQGSAGTGFFAQATPGDPYRPVAPSSDRSTIVYVPATGGVEAAFEHRLLDGSIERYSLDGRLLSEIDPTGLPTTLDYADGRLNAVRDSGGRSLVFTYDTNGLLERVLGPGNTLLATFVHSQTGLLDGALYPDGSGYTYSYDSQGGLTAVTDRSGRQIESHTYDASGRGLTSEIADGVGHLDMEYGDSYTAVSKPGHPEPDTYEWAENSGTRLITKITGTGSCPQCAATAGEWTYDDQGRVLTHKNAAGKTTIYGYDALGNVTSVQGPLGYSVTLENFDARGRPQHLVTSGGAEVTISYGPSGPLTIIERVTSSTTRATTITYRANGKPWTVQDAAGRITTFDYYPEGNLRTVQDPAGHTTTFTYNQLGWRESVRDGLNHSRFFAYDAHGRVVRATDAAGKHIDMEYDLGGRRTRVTDQLLKSTQYTYDAYGRLQHVVDPAKGSSLFGYDVESHLTSLTDAEGRTTQFEYDGLRKLLHRVLYPSGQSEAERAEELTFDEAGRLKSFKDRKGTVSVYSYDDLGRVIHKAYENDPLATPPVDYTYNALGLVESITNGTGPDSEQLTWTYDLSGQVVSEHSRRNGSTVTYDRYADGSRAQLRLGGVLLASYDYDGDGLLHRIVHGDDTFTFGYDAAHRRESLAFPNGVITTYSLDARDRLTHISAARGAVPITDVAYALGESGQRISQTQADFEESYSYDELYRLIGVDRASGTDSPQMSSFAYDDVGNRRTVQVGSALSTASFNERNELAQIRGGGTLTVRGMVNEPGTVDVAGVRAKTLPGRSDAPESEAFEATINLPNAPADVVVTATDLSGNTTARTYRVSSVSSDSRLTYDNNGNLVGKIAGGVRWEYEWSVENELRRVLRNGAEVAHYVYDPIGRRIGKTAAGTSTKYVYDGSDILRESVSGASTGAVTYIHGPGVDEPLAVDDGSGAEQYYHADGLGSILRMTDESGLVVHSYRYDAWGNIQAGAERAGYSYTGREWDPETGFYYYRARYYDPSDGRFISSDPIGFGGGVNMYSYVADRPTRHRDPSGMDWVSRAGNVVKGLAMGVGAAVVTGAAAAQLGIDVPNDVAAVAAVVATAKFLKDQMDPSIPEEDKDQQWGFLFGGGVTSAVMSSLPALQCSTAALNATQGLTMSEAEFNDLLASIAANGIETPLYYVEYNGEMYVVDGTHRLAAARVLGIASVPARQVELPFRGYQSSNDLFPTRGW